MSSVAANIHPDAVQNCAPGRPAIFVKSPASGALRQGEILCDVVESIGFKSEIISTTYPFAIVASQDCDLHQESTKGNRAELNEPDLPRVLLCLAQEAANTKTSIMGSEKWKRIASNQEARYHFFEAVSAEQDAAGKGIAELAVDFKRYFAIPTIDIYAQIESVKSMRRCVLASPYKEHFQSRFVSFLGRVGLPEDHRST